MAVEGPMIDGNASPMEALAREYQRQALTAEATPEQRRQADEAFWAGATAMFAAMLAAGGSTSNPDVAAERMHALRQELEARGAVVEFLDGSVTMGVRRPTAPQSARPTTRGKES